jgi:hypothetical protein
MQSGSSGSSQYGTTSTRDPSRGTGGSPS